MNKVRMFLGLTAIAGALSLVGCSGSTGSSPESGQQSGQSVASVSGQSSAKPSLKQSADVSIGLTYIPNVQFSPVYVAEQDKIYENAGIKPKIRHHGADEGLFTALTAGKEDVVVASGDELLQAREKGLDLISIGAFYHTYPVTIAVPEDSSIHKVADLRGHTIGIPGEYGSSWFGLLAILKQGGLTPSDVNIVPIGYTQEAALSSKKVDSVVVFSNNELIRLGMSKLQARELQFNKTQIPLVSVSLITTKKWAEADPARTRAVVDATIAGVGKTLKNPQHALEITKKYDETLSSPDAVDGARAVLNATLSLWKSSDGTANGIQDVNQWQKMADFLVTVPEALTKKTQASDAVTNDYISR